MRERVLRVAVVLAAALAASGCIDDMVQDAFYPSMSDAVADGAIRRGWIPDWVPAGATRLREVHEVDASMSALAFDLPAGAEWPLPPHCRPIRASQAAPQRLERPWWPEPQEMARDHDVFQCQAPPGSTYDEFVARRRDGAGGLHWRGWSPGPDERSK